MSLLHERFARSVARYPDAVAVDVPPGDGRPHRCARTYAQLDRDADALAARLAPHLDRPDRTVALLLPRDTPWLFAAQIAVLRRGGAYVGVDPAFPDAHVRRICDDAAPAAVVALGDSRERLRALGVPEAILIDAAAVGDAAPLPPPPWLAPEHLAYLIYTSGTTGAPKGVEISHAAIDRLIASDADVFDLGPGDRVAQGSSSAYDSSVEEIWMALSRGATVVPMDDATARLGPDLVDWLRRERITVLCPPPTLLRATGCPDPRAALPDLRLLYVGGEPLPRDVADLWAPGRRLVNGYGPTECTVTALRAEIRAGDPIVVGTPVDGLRAHILDPDLNPVPDGESGELCLSGTGLARGYRNRPDLTAQKFVAHPLLGRIYRTGDLARRLPSGDIACDGRIDAQVKLRGYRVELEAIEAELAGCAGVREAAVRVQGTSGREDLAAWVVPADPQAPPDPSVLRDLLAERLPFYMVPSRWGRIDALPRTVGGKVRRDALPGDAPTLGGARRATAARTALEAALAEAAATVLGVPVETVSVDDDFFTDLGGTSLLAARWVSLLRARPETAAATVRDVYEGRTVAALAASIGGASASRAASAPPAPPPRQRPLAVSLAQGAWLLGEALLGGLLAGWGLGTLPEMALARLGEVGALVAAPLAAALAAALWGLVAVARTVALKRLLIGRWEPGRVPVWSGAGLRHWIVVHTARQIPWGLLEGGGLAPVVLRLLGARIGRRVHFHRGAIPVSGGWDLLTVGDDATIGQEASLRLIDLEGGCLVAAPVTVGAGASVSVRATVAGGATLGAGCVLGPLAALEAGTETGEDACWDGVPASRSGDAAPASAPPEAWSEARWTVAKGLASAALGLVESAPLLGAVAVLAAAEGLGAAQVRERLLGAELGASAGTLALAAVLALPATLLLEGLLARALGRVPEGEIPLRGGAYLRVWLTTALVDASSRWLSGSLFWPLWLRLAGMRIGGNCEISTLVDLAPRMVSIASDTFCADGIYLACPQIRAGRVRLGSAAIAPDSFFGNHAVVPPGSALPPDILLGVCTVADPSRIVRGSSWFGLPAFELPRREVVDADRSLTHRPGPARFATRLFWESLRVAVPAVPAALGATWVGWSGALVRSGSGSAAAVLSAAGLAVPAALAGSVLALKWLLLGRVRPGTHPLWSCWCSRWDFLYVLWSEWALPALAPLEGTLWLNVYLRAMGMRIGRRVALSGGFSQVVDPDMIAIGDDASVAAIFQAHTFEDRVLKIDRVEIGAGATLGHGTVPLYGARIGEGAVVSANSVVMKEERLLPGLRYAGAPTRPLP